MAEQMKTNKTSETNVVPRAHIPDPNLWFTRGRDRVASARERVRIVSAEMGITLATRDIETFALVLVGIEDDATSQGK